MNRIENNKKMLMRQNDDDWKVLRIVYAFSTIIECEYTAKALR